MEKLKGNYKNSSLEENYIKEKLNPKFSSLVKKFDVSDEEIKKNLSSFLDTLEELDNCRNCKNLNECNNKIKGYVYYPDKKESKIVFGYAKCKKLKEYEKLLNEKNENNELLNARMKDIDVSDKNRVELIKYLKKFYDNYSISNYQKGIYLHGSFGSGKTFLLAALLNELKEKKKAKFEIVYYPTLLRNLKEDLSIVDSKVNYYSNVEILLLDDIGAENVTNWGRDEILGTILQYRMDNHLTTFFTSNLDINELEKHLSITKDNMDMVKARRIIERIKQLTIDMELISKNRRD